MSNIVRRCRVAQPTFRIAANLFAFTYFALAFQKFGEAESKPSAKSSAAKIEFNHDIRPILSNNCFFCHGPDPKHREADLRLDIFEEATAKRDGRAAIVPGNPAASELIQRITSTDPDAIMPPLESHKKLSESQIELLTRWVEQGAEYQSHWAYAPLVAPAAPEITDAQWKAWPRGTIDRFLLNRLLREQLHPAAEADAVVLCRRLHFDLLGLPPTAAEVHRFVDEYQGDRKEKTYEALVDRLLASPQFGERMAMWWLDLVRYADTVGYHGDQNISVWPFRDYVIRSFNVGKPFDQFTAEQLAGDLLPKRSREQLIASGYNRLGMMTAEGGAQDQEYLAKYSAERVRNLSSVWMGATVGCAECHDHKFDPYTSHDFYGLAAFFADVKEKGFYGGANSTGDWGPKLLLTTPEQEAQLKRLDDEIAKLKNAIDAASPEARKSYVAWEKKNRGRGDLPDAEKVPKEIRNILRDESGKRPKDFEDKLYAYFLDKHQPQLAGETKQLQLLNSRRKQLENAVDWTLVTESTTPRTIRVLARGNWMDETGPIVGPGVPEFLPRSRLGATSKSSGIRLSRLDLADWLTSSDNPLTPRVFANRFWAMLFGSGISKRLDDFGAQGEPPVHPELLDYLAVRFRDGAKPGDGWNIKALLKEVVLSSAYRQASTADAKTVEQDPFNRFYARQARFRFPAETVRDRALAASGLLSTKVGGRSVRPYQPAGYYAQLNFPKREYEQDTGENLWRRSLYTHWQRTFLHPALQAFDAPSREECTCERVRSNTPLQSLVLLNDPEFVEAARVLAERSLREARLAMNRGADLKGTSTETCLTWLFRFALQRAPANDERALLAELYQKQRRFYERETADAKRLIEIGESPTPTDLDTAELAAWTNVARAILNTHEFVTRD